MAKPSMTAAAVKRQLKEHVNPEKAAFYPRFFKTGKGQYGEGDKFLGVVVPDQRRIARRFKNLPRVQIDRLLDDAYHECRMTGLLILVDQFERSVKPSDRADIVKYYLSRIDAINNWDLVDATAHKILGRWLFEQSENELLSKLAATNHLWKQRIAIVATYWFIQNGELGPTLALAERYLDHEHDLIHKATGWMLREVGKQDEKMLLKFLKQHNKKMPRTMLRYSIEKLSPAKKKQFMAK